MIDLLRQPWPWFVGGPLIGLLVPVLLLLGSKKFGISSNLEHLCSALLPVKPAPLRYDWWRSGGWNLTFAAGIIVGGWITATWLAVPDKLAISPATEEALIAVGLDEPHGLVPDEIFALGSLASLPSLVLLLGGGFLVGFGARYAGGCTSGHAITRLADLQLPSLIAVGGFFVGGLIATHLLLPLIIR